MLKTVSDILEALDLDERSRTALLSRIQKKWKIRAETTHYRKHFTIENFNKIVKLENEYRMIKKNNNNYNKKEKLVYYQNKENHLYSRLTNYGGLT